MLEQFLHHIGSNALLFKEDKVLLAVSGGIDSMVMMHLFKQSGLVASVAHCNFQLRGEESDDDERFVKQVADAYGFSFHSKRFETERVAENLGISIQMAARELRYEWFDELCAEHGYDKIATAHQLNDSLETVLLHLTKGTGLDGVAGVPVRQGKIIRPILFASREQVVEYARQHSITWREDRSNTSDDYQRNFIRNNVVPLLKEINPSLDQTFLKTSERLSGGRAFAAEYIRTFRDSAIVNEDRRVRIRRKALEEVSYATVLLWEIIKSYGFNYDQCCDILSAQHQSGKKFLSSSFQLTVDRDDLIVDPLSESEPEFVMIYSHDVKVANTHFTLTIQKANRAAIQFSKSRSVAQLDADKLSSPLAWRRWREGDRFIPLGMTHHKKISDFLVDEKVSLPDKDTVTVIESQGEIVWVVGYRIADPFKITDSTTTVITLSSDKNHPV